MVGSGRIRFKITQMQNATLLRPPEGTPSALHKYPEFTGVALNKPRLMLERWRQISSNICFAPALFLFLTRLPAPGQQTEPQKPSADCRIRGFGAIGDGIANDTAAINAAVQDCHSRGGGTVVAEPGTYRTGTIRLLDNITLRLEAGATLLGSADLADYPHTGHTSEGRDTALILAEGVHDVAIIGEGTIDGNGRAFIDKGTPRFYPYFDANQTRQGAALVERLAERREGPVGMGDRPGVLVLVLHGDGIVLRDFHVVDSPNWGVKLMCSDHVSVSGLDVRNNVLVPNNDALDVSASRNVTITNTSLEAGDDALVIGGPCADGWCQMPEENVTVSNVILRSRSTAIRIGPAVKDVRNITFDNVVIRDSNRGINIQARAGEVVENLILTNIVSQTRLIDGPWWGGGEPISITAARWDYASWPKTETPGKIRHVRINHVIATSQSPIVVYSVDPGRIEDVQLQDVTLTMQPGPLNAVLGGNLDLQPTTPTSLGMVRQGLAAVEIHNVTDLTLAGLQVNWAGAFPNFYRNAVHADGFDGLTLDGFRGEGATATKPALAFAHGKSLSIRNARATSGPLLQPSKKVQPTAGVKH